MNKQGTHTHTLVEVCSLVILNRDFVKPLHRPRPNVARKHDAEGEAVLLR